jgi:hypothetical protein
MNNLKESNETRQLEIVPYSYVFIFPASNSPSVTEVRSFKFPEHGILVTNYCLKCM